MGTRALIHIRQGGTTLVTIYRQFDGYPDGLGKEIYEFLKNRTVVNGIRLGQEDEKISNGAGCLAASLIAELKEDVGNVYIFPPDSKGCGEEYVYIISCDIPALGQGDKSPYLQMIDLHDNKEYAAVMTEFDIDAALEHIGAFQEAQ